MQRLPHPALRPFVAQVWASGGDGAATAAHAQPLREHMLPTGQMHLVFRLHDSPLHIVGPQAEFQALCGALIGGARSSFYVRESSAPSCSVGAVLRPGAARWLWGVSAAELAESHTPLDALWPQATAALRDRLIEAGSAEARLALLEAALMAQLPRVRSLHPAVAGLLQSTAPVSSVGDAVRRSGVSHRRFIALFQEAVGLSPKTYLRVQRFQRALPLLRHAPLAELAAEAGYSDQSHFNRDFLDFAGVTPTAYLRLIGAEPNHLPVKFLLYGRPRQREDGASIPPLGGSP